MKKMKFLHGFLVTIIVLNTLFFFAQIYNFTVFEGAFKYSEIVLELIVILMSIIGLFFLQRSLNAIIKNGFFNTMAFSNFKKSGSFFLLAGFGSIILSAVVIIGNSYDILELLSSSLGQDILLIIIGFSLFIIADVFENGNILKIENDLTI